MYCMAPASLEVVEVPCEQPGALLVMTRLEFQASSPFYLDIESAAEIGGAVLVVMAVAFLLRAARNALSLEKETE